MALVEYPGPVPSNVNRCAKYSVVHGDGGLEIRLLHPTDDGRWNLRTDAHPDLVRMVDDVKTEVNGGRSGGSFYINEYRHVIVKSVSGSAYFAGRYEEDLEFVDDDGVVIGPLPAPHLRPGDPWPGARPGIDYTLTARGDDVYYDIVMDRHRDRVLLSDVVGVTNAARVAAVIAPFKTSGGGFYVNECRHAFGPPSGGGDFVYIGDLHGLPWFPEPSVGPGVTVR